MSKHRLVLILVAAIAALLLFVLAEILITKYNGQPLPAPTIPRAAQTMGNGSALTYVVMGDSTAIGQGAEYENSYAIGSFDHLSQHHRVTFINVAVSGATAPDVLRTQLSQAVTHKPDIVMLAVGANDARRFRSGRSIQTAIQQTIDGLRESNCAVRIVVTGAPDMGAVPRFPWPLKQLMGLRTRQVNKVFDRLVTQNKLTFAPIAAKTGPAFRADPTLFNIDKFHPTAAGYELWTPVINTALDQALQKPAPANCAKTTP